MILSPEQIRKKEQRNSYIGTVVTTLLLLLVCFWLVVWSPPDPPIPQYGIEVNFGTSDDGSGQNQSRTPPSNDQSLDQARPQPVTPNPATQPVIEPVRTPVPTAPTPASEVKAPVQAVTDEAKEAVVAQQPKASETPKAATPSSQSDQGTADKNPKSGQGETGKPGDQGKTTGSVDADALLGAGGKGGASLEMTGWKWDGEPKVNDPTNEVGKIVFEIKIDDAGEVLSVRVVYRDVSRTTADYYERAIRQLTFSPTNTNAAVSPVTTGRITFLITAK